MSRFFLLLTAGLISTQALLAQPTSSPPAILPTAPTPPVPPKNPIRTPVDLFRQLLAMNRTERQAALASRSGQVRAFLEAKIAEYETLPAPLREERLQTLQLRWHLLPLMKLPSNQRGPGLQALPEPDRKLVEERLQQWDQLSGDLQRKVLENENVIRLFFRAETNVVAAAAAATGMTPAQRNQLEKDQARWRAMSEEERQRILAHYDRFLELSSREKARILNGMQEPERRQMEVALRQFARLPKPQREACLRGFHKFAALTATEREEFLNSAQRWQEMTSGERKLWRDLVGRLQPQPPLPPGARPRTPPLPPGAAPVPAVTAQGSAATGHSLTTN
jgi:hypothetical protein